MWLNSKLGIWKIKSRTTPRMKNKKYKRLKSTRRKVKDSEGSVPSKKEWRIEKMEGKKSLVKS